MGGTVTSRLLVHEIFITAFKPILFSFCPTDPMFTIHPMHRDIRATVDFLLIVKGKHRRLALLDLILLII